MADYTHTIGILIQATDQATAVSAAATAKFEEQQAATATAAEDSAAKQEASSEKAIAAQTAMADAVGKTETSFVSLGATSEEYQANMATIAAATADAEGGITILGDSAKSTADVVIASNDRIIASYREVSVAGSASAGGSATKDAATAGGISGGVGIGAAAAAAGVAVAAGLMVKAAGDFQASMTRLVTSAGESESNLKMVSAGVLQVARDTGTGTTQLAQAMYTIESGGQHGAAGLKVLEAAAQGAKTENADLVTVADAVTSAMTDYHLPASEAATVTSKLVAATGQGKTTFQDLAGAMSAILPKASAAHISLNEILGDLASMTLHGISAQQAAENMADAISHLQSPTQAMSKELAALGLNSTELSQNLGNKGLSGTIQEVSQAIMGQMGDGTTAVVLNMENALKGLPQSVQNVSQEVINGTASWSDWNSATKDLTVTQKAQAQSFATLFNGMHTIGTEQMSGAQVMQTYAGAMNKAMGDSAGLNVALMLTGQNTKNTTGAIKAVSDATAEAGGNVKGWSEIQGNFNQQMSILKENVATAGIAIGQALLPALTTAAKDIGDVLGPIANFVDSNKTLTAGLLLTVGGLASFVAITWAVQKSSNAIGTSFSFANDMATKFAKSIGLLDTADGGGGLAKIGAELKGITAGGGAAAGAGEAVGATAEGAAGAGGAAATGTALAAATPEVAAFGTALATVAAPLAIIAAAGIGTAIVVNKLQADQTKATTAADQHATALATEGKQALTTGGAHAEASKNVEAHTKATLINMDAQHTLSSVEQTSQTTTLNLSNAHAAVIAVLKGYGPGSKQYSDAIDTEAAAILANNKAQAALTKAQGDAKIAGQNVTDTTKNLNAAHVVLNQNLPKAAELHGKLKDAQNDQRGAAENVKQAQMDVNGAVQLFGSNSPQAVSAAENLQKKQQTLSDKTQSVHYWQNQVNQLMANSKSEFEKYGGQIDNITGKANTAAGALGAMNKALAGAQPQNKSIMSKLGSVLSGMFAGGTNYAPGGIALVGEDGPELINLPQGSQVIPTPQTQQILSSSAKGVGATSGGGGSSTINLTVNVGNYMGNAADQQMLAKQIWQALQNIARQHGAASLLPNIGILPQ